MSLIESRQSGLKNYNDTAIDLIFNKSKNYFVMFYKPTVYFLK